jgi:hypothetical protein
MVTARHQQRAVIGSKWRGHRTTVPSGRAEPYYSLNSPQLTCCCCSAMVSGRSVTRGRRCKGRDSHPHQDLDVTTLTHIDTAVQRPSPQGEGHRCPGAGWGQW